VNGLEDEFGDRVQFVYLNAGDGAEGQQIFETLSLLGHPSYMLFASDGTEVYRSFGIIEAAVLRQVIADSTLP